jgi:ParB-like chromosome segregation protein Spo0J
MRKIAGKMFHEAAFLFPRMSLDERQEATASIAQLGVLEPIVYVTRPDGKRQYIDGVNRAEICHELRIDCPEEEYRVDDGKGGSRPPTDLEILDYVMARNKERRHLSSSQRAAIAVLAGTLQESYRAKAQAGMRTTDNPARMVPAEVDLPASDIGLAGDVAARVASMHGTNRAYIFKGVAVHEVRPDLILEVRDGTKSVEAAYAEAFPAPAGPEVRDVLGRLVPPALADAFRDRERFVRAQRLARELAAEVSALATGAGGAYFQPEAAFCREALDQVSAGLRRHAPHSASCPRCGGGRVDTCDLCGGRGWVDRADGIRRTHKSGRKLPGRVYPPDRPQGDGPATAGYLPRKVTHGEVED